MLVLISTTRVVLANVIKKVVNKILPLKNSDVK